MTFTIEKQSADGLRRSIWKFVLGEWRGGGLLLNYYAAEERASKRHKWKRPLGTGFKAYNRMDNRHYNGFGLSPQDVPRLTDREVLDAAMDALARYPIVWPGDEQP